MEEQKYLEPVFSDIAFEIFSKAVGAPAVRNLLEQDRIAKEQGFTRGITTETQDPTKSWWSATTAEDTLSFVIGSFRMAIPLDRAKELLEEIEDQQNTN